MNDSEQAGLVGIDSLKDQDNVLILLGNRLAVATVLPSQANRLATGPAPTSVEHPHWILPLGAIREMKSSPESLEIEFADANGQLSKLSHSFEGAPAFLETIARHAGGHWDRTLARAPSLRPALALWGMGMAVAAITAYFYFGIEGGFFQRAPSIIAAIYNILGPVGLLVAGGLLTVVLFVCGIRLLLAPGQTIHIRRL